MFQLLSVFILSRIKVVICNPGHTLEAHEKLRYTDTWPQPQLFWFYGLHSFQAMVFLEVLMCIWRLRSTVLQDLLSYKWPLHVHGYNVLSTWAARVSGPLANLETVNNSAALAIESQQQAAAYVRWQKYSLELLGHRCPHPRQGEMLSFSPAGQLLSSSVQI